MTESRVRYDVGGLVLRIFLLAVVLAFFTNLFTHWVDPTYGSVALWVIFFAGMAIYRRFWIRPGNQTAEELSRQADEH